MGITWHHAALFASGLALGGAAATAITLYLHRPAPADPPPRASAGTTVLPLARIAPVQPVAGCPLQPALAAAQPKDGRYRMPAELSGYTVRDIGAFLVIGKEAAAASRPRDAEIAFLVSCRVADQLRGAGSLEAADARYQLARVYDAALHATPMPGSEGDLRQRAEQLYSASLQIYAAQYGADHEKARFAAEGLGAVRQGATPVGAVAASTVVPPAPAPAPAAAAAPAPAPAPALAALPARATSGVAVAVAKPAAGPMAVAPRAPRRVPKAAPGAKPSFDCAKARSASEKIICADPRLARMDRELASLHARARDSARDPYIFKRRSDAEWRRREETCRDRGCLLQWYAQRRHQLLAEINSG